MKRPLRETNSDPVQLRRLTLALGLFAVLLGALALPGCSGCWNPFTRQSAQKDDEEDKDKNDPKRKPKPDFEFFELQKNGKRQQLEALPSDDLMALKPGHWASVRQPARANNFNFNGDLLTAATDSSGRPLNLERTLYRLQMTRPAALPKGQTKQLESLVFVPRREGRQGNRPMVLSRLRSRGGGSAIEESFAPALMEPFQ
ncbi:MAG: hypothetical protein KDA41_15425, partial [Planctomycetales bacterium]|nr:hypothetical protein [Planctomycetales bacterium]